MTTLDLIGCDGRVWNLLDPASPVWLANGMGGLHLPQVTQEWTQSPGKDGSTWRGVQFNNRAFTLPIVVGDQTPPYRRGQDWLDLDGLFWQGLTHDQESTLVFNGERKLRIRLDDSNGDYVFAKDPTILGKAKYPIAVVTQSTAWEGDPISDRFDWQPEPVVNYYGGITGVGPPFIISRSNLFRTATVTNPGDLPTFPIYILDGEAGLVTFGVEGAVDTLPFSLNDGDSIIVDCEAETIVDSQGNDRWADTQHTLFNLAPLPPGDVIPVRIGIDGGQVGAGITITRTPRFRRAWGVGGSPVGPGPGPGGDGFGHTPFGHGPFGH